MRLVQTIRHLLHKEGYTIAGADKRLLSKEEDSFPLFKRVKPDSREVFLEIKQELEEILKDLSGNQS